MKVSPPPKGSPMECAFESFHRTLCDMTDTYEAGATSSLVDVKGKDRTSNLDSCIDGLHRTTTDTPATGISATTITEISKWKIVVAGQIISFLGASSGATQATLHLRCHFAAPTFEVALMYAGLALCCLIPLWWQQHRTQTKNYHGDYQRTSETIMSNDQRSEESKQDGIIQTQEEESISNVATYSFCCGTFVLHNPWYIYACMAVLDVYANFAIVSAFRYTTLTSIALLDAVSIPTSMLLSRFCLQRKYSMTHFLGVIFCLVGMTLNILKDFDDDQGNSSKVYPHKLRGDLLSITGGILFGCNNVLGETAVKHSNDPNEVYGVMSLFAVCLCAVQTAFIERSDAMHFFQSSSEESSCSITSARLLLLAFVAINVVGYMGGARFLLYSEAAFFNLSLLTADFWSVGFVVVVEHISPAPVFYFALFLTIAGVLLYELAVPTPDHYGLKGDIPWTSLEMTPTEIEKDSRVADYLREFPVEETDNVPRVINQYPVSLDR